MRTPTKLAAYGALLLLVFAGSFGLGRTWDPTNDDQPDPTPPPAEVHGSGAPTEESAS